MTAAEDTLAERIAEYRRLFDHALEQRESTESTTTFRLADRPGVRDWVLDWCDARLPAARSSPTRSTSTTTHVVWTVSGGVGASDMAVLDEFFASADPANSSSLIARRDSRTAEASQSWSRYQRGSYALAETTWAFSWAVWAERCF